MWTDTRDCVPLADGIYTVQTVTNEVTSMSYTFDRGWNTFRDCDGNLRGEEDASMQLYVVRWLEYEQPPKVPKEWVDEWFDAE